MNTLIYRRTRLHQSTKTPDGTGCGVIASLLSQVGSIDADPYRFHINESAYTAAKCERITPQDIDEWHALATQIKGDT